MKKEENMKTLLRTFFAKVIVYFVACPEDLEIHKAISYKHHAPWAYKVPCWHENNKDSRNAYEKHKDNLHVLAFPWGGD